jgi:hypothetical protein
MRLIFKRWSRSIADRITESSRHPISQYAGRAVEEVIFSGPLPDKVPPVLRVDADWAAAVATPRMKCAGRRCPLTIPAGNSID